MVIGSMTINLDVDNPKILVFLISLFVHIKIYLI